MWKVMIADDEPKIRRGLKAAIERARPDMSVVAEAEDGAMALELAEREHPDILFIDIRMPIMNGLQVIERLAAERRGCLIIVVSGHDEFEYAKKALQLKVFEYLLKPVSREALAAVLARADAELAGTRRQDLYLAWAREQLAKNMPLLREQFLRDWVADRLSRSEIEEQVEFLGLRIAEDPSVAVIHLVERVLAPEASGERSRRLALYAVRSVVEELLAAFAPVSVFQDEHDNIVAITASPGSAWSEAISAIESRVSQSLAHGVIVASRHVAGGFAGVPETYETLAAEISRKASFGSFVVLAQGYIDAHYADPGLSLEEVAAEAEISPGYLSRLLKQETGFSFVDYLTRVRITQALQMLANPSMKIYEVAEAVGYQSQHYFSRAFKRVFGRSPVEYRKGGHP